MSLLDVRNISISFGGLKAVRDFSIQVDRGAPIRSEDETVSFGQARRLVLDTYRRFSPEAGVVLGRFFDEHDQLDN